MVGMTATEDSWKRGRATVTWACLVSVQCNHVCYLHTRSERRLGWKDCVGLAAGLLLLHGQDLRDESCHMRQISTPSWLRGDSYSGNRPPGRYALLTDFFVKIVRYRKEASNDLGQRPRDVGAESCLVSFCSSNISQECSDETTIISL